jgi:ABC-type multidrug transport system ATPase subunit
MGPSGAGKTSLLDIVAGRKNTGRYEGHIMVDSVEYASLKTRKDVFGYVMQEETLVPELTVREALEFSARLRTTASRCCG